MGGHTCHEYTLFTRILPGARWLIPTNSILVLSEPLPSKAPMPEMLTFFMQTIGVDEPSAMNQSCVQNYHFIAIRKNKIEINRKNRDLDYK